MPRTLEHTTTFAIETCCECSVLFAMPDELQQRRRADGKLFYCPHGHAQHYTELEIDRLRLKAKRLEAELTSRIAAQDQAEADAAQARRTLAATRGANTRLRRRVAHGSCPVCRAVFLDMARHMHRQHPTFEQIEE